MVIIRRINCINTTSGICHSVSMTVSCAGQKGIIPLRIVNCSRSKDIKKTVSLFIKVISKNIM